ncbi:MAG: hypothetical protein SGI77_11380 [Pirellulaceae bacterium]|nr:hypothetical protein [Pirellulaceae bacterium]
MSHDHCLGHSQYKQACYACQRIKQIREETRAANRHLDHPDNAQQSSTLAGTQLASIEVVQAATSSPKPKQRRKIIPCIHRGDYVGELGCSCDGTRETYRCTKLDRPEHLGEKAFCIQVLASKPYSRIVDPKTKQTLHRVKNGEVILCKELYTVAMNGSEQIIGCRMYDPFES